MGAKRKKRKRETKLFFIVEFWRRRREHFQKNFEFKEKGTLANFWHGFQGKVWHENQEISGKDKSNFFVENVNMIFSVQR